MFSFLQYKSIYGAGYILTHPMVLLVHSTGTGSVFVWSGATFPFEETTEIRGIGESKFESNFFQ